MQNVLEKIAESTRARVAAQKQRVSFAALRQQTAASSPAPSFCAALRAPGLSLICEVKKASPSKGMIVKDFPYLQIAQEYETAGAAVISVLTEPAFFRGSDAYLREIATQAHIPCLRKDFIVDAYQIYEAKVLGAAAVLLICALVGPRQLTEYIALARSLGMDALVETHNPDEIAMALEAGADVIGVNNRDLRTFEVRLDTCLQLKALVPGDKIFVAESGIASPADTRRLLNAGVDAALIGETLMRADDKSKMIGALRWPN
ncbi:MAG: indole-3-glycerol phosphate synthase TrpC [Oscillospiraceae bacterium]|jgi:indole-3-glycerol phosphate synthase|nr:indole-3-glycerol phosphate synthase TrpC [Oscillospiraceae bacterium]